MGKLLRKAICNFPKISRNYVSVQTKVKCRAPESYSAFSCNESLVFSNEKGNYQLRFNILKCLFLIFLFQFLSLQSALFASFRYEFNKNIESEDEKTFSKLNTVYFSLFLGFDKINFLFICRSNNKHNNDEESEWKVVVFLILRKLY